MEPLPLGTSQFLMEELDLPATPGVETVLLAGARSRRLHALLEERRAQREFVVDDDDVRYADPVAELEEGRLLEALRGMQASAPQPLAPLLTYGELGEVISLLAA